MSSGYKIFSYFTFCESVQLIRTYAQFISDNVDVLVLHWLFKVTESLYGVPCNFPRTNFIDETNHKIWLSCLHYTNWIARTSSLNSILLYSYRSKAVCFQLITRLASVFCYKHRHNGRYYLQKHEQIVRLTSRAEMSFTYGNVTASTVLWLFWIINSNTNPVMVHNFSFTTC